MKIRKAMVAGLVAAWVAVPAAQASLAISNGDFEDDAVQTSNVTNWFDTVTGTPANWWESTWAGPTVSPNGTSVLGLSYMFTTPNWAYQSIGVNDGGETSLVLQYDVGSFTDAGGIRDLGVTFAVYSVDGTYAGGADNVDIDGAAGATLLDSVSVMHEDVAIGTMLVDQTVALDITGTSGSELYVRLINYAGVDGEPWTAVDNIEVIPEPATISLVGIFGAGVLFMRRRFKI